MRTSVVHHPPPVGADRWRLLLAELQKRPVHIPVEEEQPPLSQVNVVPRVEALVEARVDYPVAGWLGLEQVIGPEPVGEVHHAVPAD